MFWDRLIAHSTKVASIRPVNGHGTKPNRLSTTITKAHSTANGVSGKRCVEIHSVANLHAKADGDNKSDLRGENFGLPLKPTHGIRIPRG